jgi:SET domain-containing protein
VLKQCGKIFITLIVFLQKSVDATEYVPKKGPGRFINHSRNGNLQPTKVMVDGGPRLALISKRDITKGEELFFDYGDRSENALQNFPWLKQ